MDANTDEDSINRIRFIQENIFGEKMELSNIDKVQGVIIRLRSREDVEVSKNYLIAMLEELIRKENAEVKKQKLRDDYGLVMNEETERRVNVMCNLSEVMLEEFENEKKALESETLRSMVKTVKSLVGDDFNKVCEIIRNNEIYKKVSDADIRKYWNE